MNIYLLEKGTYKRIDVVDSFKSFIWTERMSSPGDCEVIMLSKTQWDKLTIGRILTHTKTKEAMIIEERHSTTDQLGERLYIIRGRSLDTLLEKRSVIPPTGKATWLNHGPIWEAITLLVKNFALSSTSMGGANDVIPELYRYIDVNDQQVHSIAVKIQSLYTAIKDLADSRNLRFGIDLNPSSPRLRFYTIEGEERQIMFSTQLDTLSDPSFLHTNADHYNTAYIWSNEGKYRTSVGSTSATGINRRILTVEATDLDINEDTNSTQLMSQMRQRGLEELAKHKELRLFDGKLSGDDPYVYRTHYQLGDIVTLMDEDNNKQKVRVSEYIFAQDEQGFRSYPTFATID